VRPNSGGKAETYAHRNVVTQVAECFVATTADAEAIPALAEKLGIRVYPTTVIISPDAQIIDSMTGYVWANDMSSRLSAAADEFKTTTR
jgi:hypothetical protein